MTPESAVSFFIALFIFGITPGPGVLAILARALSGRKRDCLPLALGMVGSDLIYLIMACFGLSALAENWGGLFTVIRIAGAGYLLYLGWQLFRSPMPAHDDHAVSAGQSRKSFLQGFLISASNPKVILFYIAFLPTFMDLTALSHQDILLAAGLASAALTSGLMLIAVLAGRARRMLSQGRGGAWLNRSAGTVMMGAGLYLLNINR